MKRKTVGTISLIITFLCALLFAACTGCRLLSLPACDIGSQYNNYALVDGVFLMGSDTVKKSLAAYCEWDGDENNTEFTVPDEYCGYTVSCLGAKGNPGFSGKPSPFHVQLPDEIGGLKVLGLYSFVPEDCNADNTFNLYFTVNLGKYVNEILRIRKASLYGLGIWNDGAEEVKAYYKVTINYNVDGENATFYSRNGDIYYKSNDSIITYLPY